MRARTERRIFKEILSYTPQQLTSIFSVSDEGSFFRFTEKGKPTHYITVDKTPEESFWVPINADFNFERPAGSNNYPELIKVGKYLVQAFGLTIGW